MLRQSFRAVLRAKYRDSMRRMLTDKLHAWSSVRSTVAHVFSMKLRMKDPHLWERDWTLH